MMTQTRAFIATKLSIALLWGLLLGACGSPDPASRLVPLLDARHAADILTEARRISPPPALGGNRFLVGWFPWKHEDTPVLVPHADGATIQIVNISGGNRYLQLEVMMLGESTGDHQIEVDIDGRSIGSVPLSEAVEIALPGDLPRGRIPVRLRFPPGPDPVVLNASLNQAVSPGEVEIQDQSILQAPTSLIDMARSVTPGARLVGRFEPPAHPRPGQRFSIVLEGETGEMEAVFDWQPGWLERLRGDRSFDIPLPTGSEFVRIRLRAEGSGPAARWRDLALSHEVTDSNFAPAPGKRTTERRPPRLVVLYVLDALRADYVDLDGGPDSPTPTLARLAREGVVFERHLSIAPNTIPSTKSLFTGQTYFTQGNAKLAGDGPETLAEVFVEAGYRTAAFSGNEYISHTYGTSRGFDHLAEEVVFSGYADVPGAYNDNAERVHASALTWLDQLADDERAFVYLHTIHPHNPYDPPAELARHFVVGVDSQIDASSRTLLDIKQNRLDVTPADRQRIAGLYTAGLAYNDRHLGLLIEELEQRFPSREILLVVTSDHGEELFDHDGVLHGYTLYREQLEIPLILWWPESLAPRRITHNTSNLDLHESLRQLLGAAPSQTHEGRSFWPLIDSPSEPRDERPLRFAAASSVQGGIFMTQSDRYKLVFAPRVGRHFGMGEGRGRNRDSESLFDLQSDPEERVNLVGATSPEVDWMRSRLTAWIREGLAREVEGEAPTLDEETQMRLRALGYLE